MNNAAPATLELRHGPVSAIDLALYAAASGDHNPLHLDADVAGKAGFERPVVHGMLTMAVAARLFTSHFGPTSLRSLSTRFTGAALRGDTLLLVARLESDEGQTARYSLSGRTLDGSDIVTGAAVVSLSA